MNLHLKFVTSLHCLENGVILYIIEYLHISYIREAETSVSSIFNCRLQSGKRFCALFIRIRVHRLRCYVNKDIIIIVFGYRLLKTVISLLGRKRRLFKNLLQYGFKRNFVHFSIISIKLFFFYTYLKRF